MKKISAIVLSTLLLAGCSNGANAPAETAAATAEASAEATAETVETTVPEETAYDFSELKIIAPMGAPALSLLPVLKDNSNAQIVNGPETLQAALVNPEPEYDVIVAPTNLGVKLAAAGKTDYRMLAVVTWGNMFVVADDENIIDNADAKLALFGENAVGGLVFKSLYPEPAANVTWYDSVTDAQAALLSDKANGALLAEPAATATIAKAKESGKEFKIVVDLQEEWGGGYPQAGLYVRTADYEENKDLYDAMIAEMTAYAENAASSDKAGVVADIDAVGAETLGVPNSAIVGKVWDRMGVEIVKASECVEELDKFLGLFDIANSEAAVIK